MRHGELTRKSYRVVSAPNRQVVASTEIDGQQSNKGLGKKTLAWGRKRVGGESSPIFMTAGEKRVRDSHTFITAARGASGSIYESEYMNSPRAFTRTSRGNGSFVVNSAAHPLPDAPASLSNTNRAGLFPSGFSALLLLSLSASLRHRTISVDWSASWLLRGTWVKDIFLFSWLEKGSS